eukprot:Rhum_TRINITY_DN20981_c0_g1::Rhum_TRINITY_DN20981_c0_g1_i1::g.172538::m.172538
MSKQATGLSQETVELTFAATQISQGCKPSDLLVEGSARFGVAAVVLGALAAVPSDRARRALVERMRDEVLATYTTRSSLKEAYSSHLRYAQCALRLHAAEFARRRAEGAAVGPTGDALYQKSALQLLSREDFASSWKSLMLHKRSVAEAYPKTREARQMAISMKIAAARAVYGNGKVLEFDAKEASASEALRHKEVLETKVSRLKNGLVQITAKVADPAKRELLLSDKAKAVSEAEAELEEYTNSNAEYKVACAATEAYAAYLSESGIGELLEARDQIMHSCSFGTPPASARDDERRESMLQPEYKDAVVKYRRKTLKNIGDMFEAEAAEAIARFHEGCAEAHVLTNVSLKTRLPSKASGEIDALVVLREEIRYNDSAESPPTPAVVARRPRFRVTRILGQYEVKVNSDDVVSSAAGHARAISHLASLAPETEIRCSTNTDHVFPAGLWQERLRTEGECPVTFVSLLGAMAPLVGSTLPLSMLSPTSILTAVVQHVLDTYMPTLDWDVLTSDFSYIDEAYDNLGQTFTGLRYAAAVARSGATELDRQEYLEEGVRAKRTLLQSLQRVRDAANDGRVWFLPDPFSQAYSELGDSVKVLSS